MNMTRDWHAVPADEVLAELEVDPGRGLVSTEIEPRQARFGRNSLPPPPRRGILRRFLSHFHNVLIYVLLFAAAVTLLLQHYIDAAVIFAVVLVNSVIGFIQEGKAEQAMETIRGMLAPHATVLRDGKRHSIDSRELVPGDIVLLEAGDRVPADIRLLRTHGLQVQEAILTGESLPVEKSSKAVDASAALGDRTSLCFSGTTVSNGQGSGVVVATGTATEIGRISGLLAEVRSLTTPLLQQMDSFARWLSLFIGLLAVVMLGFGHFVLAMPFAEIFMAVVGLSVAAIPEGLPAVLTITLAVGVQAMARRNAIVRRLPAIETLGSISVICTDKTGTLTRNEMSVATLALARSRYAVEGEGYSPSGEIHPEMPEASIARQLGLVSGLCNDAELHPAEGGDWSVDGDPMEGALLAFAGRLGAGHDELRKQWTRTDVIPFDARHRYMATLHHDHRDSAFILLKGAPEKVLELCGEQVGQEGGEPLDRDYWETEASRIAADGQRVLALAVRPVSPQQVVLQEKDVTGSMQLLGLVGLIDPPRTEAMAAVAECHRAGIAVKMITGDHAATATAIAARIGLRKPEGVLTGADLDRLDDAGLVQALQETDVFARTSPEHKLRLVTALQARGMTVAMTGDGVNDAPALKRADAGVAMGRKGSEAAKEASEFVLADDNFASIVAAIREGRRVYDNIVKVISWTLPTNAGEASTIMLALMLGMMLPVTPVQILWVNMVTAVTLGIALAFEPVEERSMQRPPRPRSQPLLTPRLAWHIVLVATLFLVGVFGCFNYALERGYSVELARTMAMNTLVVMEMFHLFFIRNLYGTSLTLKAIAGTPAVWLAVIVVTLGQFALTYWPPLQKVFATEAVPFFDGLLIVGIGVLLFAVIEIEKQLHLRLKTIRVG